MLFSRPFYCRNIRDAVYFYCFYHGYSYDHCRELLRQVQAIEGYADGGDPIDTQVICNKLQQIRPGDDVELLRFIQYNGGAFTSWETKAFAVLRHLLVHVKGKAEDVDQLKAYVKNHDYKTIDQAGYVVQDYARLHHNGKMEFANIHIDSIDFMLNMMLNVRKMDKRQLQFSVTPSICKLIQRNFPDRNGFYAIMSHIIEQYFSGTDDNTSDYISEGLLRSLIQSTRIAVKNPRDYEARSNIMSMPAPARRTRRLWNLRYHMLWHRVAHPFKF